MLIHPHSHSYSCPHLCRYSHILIHHYHHRKEALVYQCNGWYSWFSSSSSSSSSSSYDHKVAAVVYQRRARASDREPKSRERRPASLLCCNHLYIVHTCIGRTITMQVKEMNRNDARNLCTSCKSKAYASTRTNKVFTVVMFISKTVIQRWGRTLVVDQRGQSVPTKSVS